MLPLYLFISTLFLSHIGTILCDSEHKVHNIVLYPEKHSWCQLTPIQQVVSSPGFEPVTIENNVCVGACYSYSIPETEPAEPGEVIRPYCDSCQPAEIKCYHVNLSADNSVKTSTDSPKILQKRVEIITRCSCQSCDSIRKKDCEISNGNTVELPKNLYTDHQESYNKSTPEDFPDLFDAQNTQNNTKKHFENDIKLKDQLKLWFEEYQNETNGSEKIVHHKHSELLDLQKKMDNSERNNEIILKDLENLPKSFGAEGAPSHHKGAHIGMGLSHKSNSVDNGDFKKSGDHKSGHHHSHHAHHQAETKDSELHHKHYLGEVQQTNMNLAHLVRGPHGSLALNPVEVKFHIDTDALQPNDEGMVIEYQNHHHKNNIHKIDDLMQEE